MMDRWSTAVTQLRQLYSEQGGKHYGEDVTQLSHALSSAEHAKAQGASRVLILAAFYHDIGHLLEFAEQDMGHYGSARHDVIGAHYLRQCGFGAEVTEPVANHVMAKRYLCWLHPHYYQSLSNASQISLEYQGGPLNDEQARQFEQGLYFSDSIQLRDWDDQAKVRNYSVDDADWVFDLTESYFREVS